MKEMILLLSTIIILSCNSEKSAKSMTTDADSIIVESSSPENKGDTLFTVFFEAFMWDKEFQKSRVVFPFKKDSKTISISGDWKHLPFYTQSDYIPILSSDTLRLYDKDITTSEIELSLIDLKRNIFDKFNFKKINNHWFLLSSESFSLENVPDYEFVDFLTKFSTDSIFQINHTRFPITELYADSDNDYETVTRTIALEDWKHLNLIESLNQLMVLSNIEIDNKYRNIFFRGVENGIWVKYTFEKIIDNWKLIRLEDFST
jgi:hypothetical protein